MKVTYKKYRCGTCFNIQEVQTNHFGEIYSKCKLCNNNVLECIEPEALEIKKNKKLSKAIVHFYTLDLTDGNDKEQYEFICSKFNHNQKAERIIDYKTFDYLKSNYNKTEINIYNKETFENQFIGDGVRWFYWFEKIISNQKIKTGYFLEFKNGD